MLRSSEGEFLGINRNSYDLRWNSYGLLGVPRSSWRRILGCILLLPVLRQPAHLIRISSYKGLIGMNYIPGLCQDFIETSSGFGQEPRALPGKVVGKSLGTDVAPEARPQCRSGASPELSRGAKRPRLRASREILVRHRASGSSKMQ